MITDENAGFDISRWTPDSQQALIMREAVKKGYEQYQSIELFNARTIKIPIYAKRSPGEYIYDSPPLWLAGLNAVVYPERDFISESHKDGQPDPTIKYLLELSRGNPADIPSLENATWTGNDSSNASKFFSSIAVKPDGGEIIYLRGDGKGLYQREVSQGSLTSAETLPFDLTQWDPSAGSYKMSWRP
ncbi:MAG TPA: hypothetical protein VLX61_07530 [Anaerolineales bacterium]|nr:hypothetical protein [Anaerolineales bacterium]